MTLTFKKYLASRRMTNRQAGDFTKDARADRDFPDVNSWEELRAYLARKAQFGAVEEVIAAGQEVWRSYQRAIWNSPCRPYLKATRGRRT